MKVWSQHHGLLDVEIEQDGELLIKVYRVGVMVKIKGSEQVYEIMTSNTWQESITDRPGALPEVKTTTTYNLLPVDDDGDEVSDRVPIQNLIPGDELEVV